MAGSDSFTISCETEVRFGVGRNKELLDLLKRRGGNVALVHGVSGISAMPILRELRRSGLNVHKIKCVGEPSVPAVNAALQELDGSIPNTVVACGGGSAIDMGKAISVLAPTGSPIPNDFDQIDPTIFENDSGGHRKVSARAAQMWDWAE